MLTNTELVKQWHLPPSQTNTIVAFANKNHLHLARAYQMYQIINNTFEANVIKNQKTQKYYGVLYMFNQRRQVKIAAISPGFQTPLEAARCLNNDLNSKEFNWATCYQLGVIPQARQLIAPIDEARFKIHHHTITVSTISPVRAGRSE